MEDNQMRVKINQTELPIETTEDLAPITIRAAVSDGDGVSGWGEGEILMEIDSGADCTVIPLPILKKLLGENLRLEEAATMQTADGAKSQVAMTKISLRIKTGNGEVVTINQVDCSVPNDGSVLLGRNVLQVFRVVLVQNKLQSMVLSPKAASYLGLGD
jgi:hypothetical protein